jgi:hypothetical protein
MSDMATLMMERSYFNWDLDENAGPDLYEYIVSPEPFADSWYDEGAGD